MELQFYILITLIPLLLSWLIPNKLSVLPMILVTTIFIYIVSPTSLYILFFNSLLSYYGIKQIKNTLLIITFITMQIVLVFIYYKINMVSNQIGKYSSAIPFGLSYYSFRIIHYSIESYKNKLPKHSFLEYLSYLFFLPNMLVGPINKFQNFLVDQRRRRWNIDWFSNGLERVLYGWVKIVLIGNYFFSGKIQLLTVDFFNKSEWITAYVKMLSFAANAYFQFAGFSDIAIGLALLFGYRLNENFNAPFLAKNITDFWRRWHMSLSEWCRDYVFYPVLGSTRNVTISVVISMLVLSLWHEFSFRYIIWGILHALFIALWNKYEVTNFYKKTENKVWVSLVYRFLTLHFVILSFVIVGEKNIDHCLSQYKILFFLN